MTYCTACRGTGFDPDTWPMGLDSCRVLLGIETETRLETCSICAGTGLAQTADERRKAIADAGVPSGSGGTGDMT